MSEQVKAGIETSEHKAAVSGRFWGIVAMILGLVLSLGAALLPTLGDNTRAGIILGALVALAGIGQQTLTSLGYIKARTDVKLQAMAPFADSGKDGR